MTKHALVNPLEWQGLLHLYQFFLDSYYYNSQNEKIVANRLFGTVDYEEGEVELGYIKGQEFIVYNTVMPNGIIEVRATPRNNDVVVDKSVYIDFDVAKSNIQATVDTRIAGS